MGNRPEVHPSFYERLEQHAAASPHVAAGINDFLLDEVNDILDALAEDYLGLTVPTLFDPEVRRFRIVRSFWLERGVGIYCKQIDGQVWLTSIELMP